MNSTELRKRKPRTRSALPSVVIVRPRLLKSHTWPTDCSAWPAYFNHPREFDLTIEDESWQDFVHGHCLDSSSDEDSDDSASDEEGERIDESGNTATVSNLQAHPSGSVQDPLRTFMTELGGEDRIPLRTQEVLSFCQHVKGQLGAEDDLDSKRVALVDDQSTAKAQENLPLQGEMSCDLLTRSELHKRLSKPRFPLEGREDNFGIPRDYCGSPTAHRRLICYPGLDAEGIRDLANTAPRGQRPALAAFFYRHIKPESMISVEIESGFPTYALNFHAPYYALREHEEVRQDPRRWPSGETLRVTRTPSCLNTVSTRRWCLYELQISILVYGISNCVWTAYGSYDDYHDDRSSIESQYDKWSCSEPQVLQDPLTKGALPKSSKTGALIWDGRTYFLHAVEQQYVCIMNEWEAIISKLEGEAKKQSPPPPGSSTGLRTSPSIQAFESWSEDMIRTLTTLISCLSGMMRARHSFETHNIRYFGPDRPGAKRCDHAESNLKLRTDFLDHIQRIFSVFEIYLARLNDLKKQMIIDNRHAVVTLRRSESHQATVQVNKMAEVVIIFLPFSIAAGIFNMQPNILPFNPNLGSFVGCVIVVGLAVAVAYALMVKQKEWVEPGIHIIWARLQAAIDPGATSEKPQATTGPDSRSTAPAQPTEQLLPEGTTVPIIRVGGTAGPKPREIAPASHRVMSSMEASAPRTGKSPGFWRRFRTSNSEFDSHV